MELSKLSERDPPDFIAHFLEGIEHFNSRRFWEAHESWETIWLVAESEVEQFLQGLIQVTAAYHHISRGTLSGAGRLFDAALGRLDPFPEEYCGIDRAPLREVVVAHRRWVGELLARNPGTKSFPERLPEQEFPRIRLEPGWREKVPPARP